MYEWNGFKFSIVGFKVDYAKHLYSIRVEDGELPEEDLLLGLVNHHTFLDQIKEAGQTPFSPFGGRVVPTGDGYYDVTIYTD